MFKVKLYYKSKLIDEWSFETIEQARELKQNWIYWNCRDTYIISDFQLDIVDTESNDE